MANGHSVWIASFVDEILVDIPDKIATFVICYIIYKGLPNNLTLMYEDQEIQDF